jgi:hypothetical protein
MERSEGTESGKEKPFLLIPVSSRNSPHEIASVA